MSFCNYKARIFELSSAAALLVGTTLPAYAQNVSANSGSTSAEAVSSSGLTEVVVTAQRREQSMQEVPIAVTAVTGESLVTQGLTDLTGLSLAAPSLSLTMQAGAVRVILRGVGGPAANGIDPSTAIFVDEVYMGGAANLWHLDDVERIEILKGPQGTLFGRNATAGVIQVFTQGPSQNFKLTAKAGYERFDTLFGSTFISGGLSDTVSASLSAQGRDQRDGWTRNITLNEDTDKGKSYTIRPKILWQPGGNSSWLLGGEISFNNYTQGMNYSPVRGTVTAGGGVYTGGDYATENNFIGAQERPTRAVYLKGNQQFGGLDLVSVSAYRTSKLDFHGDLDAGPAPILNARVDEKIENFSQEIRLQSAEGSTVFGKTFSWIAGGYYLHGKDAATTTFTGAAFAPLASVSTFGDQRTDSISVFGDITLEVLPKTDLSLGTRYNHDEMDIAATRTTVLGGTATTAVTPNPVPSTTEEVWSYRAVLNHRFTDDVMAYVSYARGYKPGGYGLLSPTATPVNSEFIKSAEAGIKTTWLDQRLLLNAAVFNYDYSDLQVNVFGANNTITTINAASARINGLEIDLQARPIENLSLTASLSLLDGEYRDFENGPTYVPRPATCASVPPYPAPTGGFVACPVDLTGNDMINAPPYQLSLGATYTIALPGGSEILVGGLYSRTDQFEWWPDNNPIVAQPTVDLLNLSVGWTSADGKYTVRAYARNAFDEQRAANTNESTTNLAISLAEPRVVGGFVEVKF